MYYTVYTEDILAVFCFVLCYDSRYSVLYSVSSVFKHVHVYKYIYIYIYTVSDTVYIYNTVSENIVICIFIILYI